MKPATQAKAWRARTREFRNRIAPTFQRSAGSVSPAIHSGVGSASATEATTSIPVSIVAATIAAPTVHDRTTGHGLSFQRRSVERVSLIPCTKTKSLAPTPTHRQTWAPP